jgi:hypothetical protein
MSTPRSLVTGIAAAALVLVPASGAALTASAGDQPAGSAWSARGPAGRHARFADQHGPVLPAPQLYLIYWGTAWKPQTAAAPTPAEVTGAVRTLMGSGYLTGLAQYRGSGHGALRGSALITTSEPPDGFTDHQVAAFIDAQLSAGTIPGPGPGNQTVYGVVMPTWVLPEHTGRTGEHNSYPRSGQKIHYAWLTNFGDLGGITATISHELVESATDPDGSGFLGIHRTCHGPGWCEIADICQSTRASIDGITVHAYWSNQAGACIAPGNRWRDRGRQFRRDTGRASGCGAGRASGCGAGRACPGQHLGHRQRDLGQVKRHIRWIGGDPAQAQRPQAGPARVTDQQDLAKAKRDVVLHAGQQARGVSARAVPAAARAAGTRPLAGPQPRAAASQVHGFSVACCPGRLASRERVRSASTTIRRSW